MTMTREPQRSEGGMKIDDQMRCPSCNEPFAIGMVAKAQERSRMSFCVSPKDGEKLSAEHLGGMIQQFAKLLGAVSKDLGWHSTTMIDSIATQQDGTIQIDVLIARSEKPPLKRKPT